MSMQMTGVTSGHKGHNLRDWVRSRAVRRTFVAIYALALATALWFGPSDKRMLPAIAVVFGVGSLLAVLVAPVIVQQTPLHLRREVLLDERQKQVRQKALADAYVCLLLAAIPTILWFALRSLHGFDFTRDVGVRMLVMGVGVLATLPQAFIAWREPDQIEAEE